MAPEQGFNLVPISGWDRELDFDTSVHMEEMSTLLKGFRHKYHKYY